MPGNWSLVRNPSGNVELRHIGPPGDSGRRFRVTLKFALFDLFPVFGCRHDDSETVGGYTVQPFPVVSLERLGIPNALAQNFCLFMGILCPPDQFRTITGVRRIQPDSRGIWVSVIYQQTPGPSVLRLNDAEYCSGSAPGPPVKAEDPKCANLAPVKRLQSKVLLGHFLASAEPASTSDFPPDMPDREP
ncbi:hypothetical protein [Streptomyces hirsutus]|uniref:hypothetical protein n=1 Tax=Streptomyces hirsutus TaxID=35620 RepID=UPI00200EFDBA|nr:hypothetical protein [Streptomyces hirsutus]